MLNHGGSNKNCSWAVNSSPKSHLCFLAYCLETQRSRPLSFWFCPISISPDSLKIFEINIFNASPSFSIIYWIMLFWNYWTTQNCTEKCLLCLWLKCKKSLIFRCCPVCRESLFTPFFSRKERLWGFLLFGLTLLWAAWQCEAEPESRCHRAKAGDTLEDVKTALWSTWLYLKPAGEITLLGLIWHHQGVQQFFLV